MRRLFLCLSMCLASTFADTPPAPGGLEGLTPEQKQEAKARMEEYRQTAFDPFARERVVREVVKLPRAVQGVFLAVVEEDFKKALQAYKTEFQKTAETLARKRESKAVKDEIKRLRAAVLALQAKGGGPTKEEITRIGDPALARLKELQTFDRAVVIRSNSGLDIPRDRLLALVKSRQELRKAMAMTDPKDYAPEKLVEEEKNLTVSQGPFDRDAVKIMEANKKLQASVPAEEAQGVLVTNELRATLGLTALTIDPKLCNAARGHSKDMVEKGFFAHESPVPGKKSPWDRAKLAGTSASAENIYAGSSKPEDAVMAWWHSPGHFVNMLNPGHKRMGMGRHAGDWTQMFGG